MSDISKKSFEEILDLLREKAREHFPDKDWSGLQEFSLEDLLVKVVAEASTLNGQYLDLRSRQAYLATADIYRDVRRTLENLGGTTVDRAGATLTMNLSSSDTLTVPAGTLFGTSNGTKFSTVSDLVLNSGNSYAGTVEAVNSEYTQVSVRSVGEIAEKIELNKKNILVDFLSVSVNGNAWSRVTDLGDVDSASQIYQVKFNDNDTAYLLFGDGTYGQRLPADASIDVDVFEGGGPQGNGVAVGSVTKLLTPFANSNLLRLITNTTTSTGGKARDSLASIRAAVPAQQRQVAGLINRSDFAGALKKHLSWLADASVERTFENVNGVAVPTATVTALPYSNEVASMDGGQQSALSAVLTNKGELGVQFNVRNPRNAPVKLKARVRLANKNLSAQKEAEIKKALNAVSGSSPFVFDSLGFDKSYLKQDIVSVIESVDGVVFASIEEFHKVPYALSVSGTLATTSSFRDIEIDQDSQDGYLEFVAVSTSDSSGSFYLPFKPDQIGSDFARDTSKDLSVLNYSFGSGSGDEVFNDSDGPYIKPNPTKLNLWQTNKVWTTNEFSGSNWKGKHLLRVAYVENGTPKQWFYHIASNDYRSLTTVEDATAPLNGGVGVSGTLALSSISQVEYSVLRDMTNGSTGEMVTPNNQTMGLTYNNQNTLFFSSIDALAKVPVGEYSHVKFGEPVFNTPSPTGEYSYFTAGDAIRVRFIGAFATGDKVRIYTSEKAASKLDYKHPSEVFSLDDSDIEIVFI